MPMKNNHVQAIGVVEVSFYANAVYVLDAMEKAAEIELASAEKLLGGRLVSIIVTGTTSDVQAAVQAAKCLGDSFEKNPVKVAITINSPHPEILKFILPGAREVNRNEKTPDNS